MGMHGTAWVHMEGRRGRAKPKTPRAAGWLSTWDGRAGGVGRLHAQQCGGGQAARAWRLELGHLARRRTRRCRRKSARECRARARARTPPSVAIGRALRKRWLVPHSPGPAHTRINASLSSHPTDGTAQRVQGGKRELVARGGGEGCRRRLAGAAGGWWRRTGVGGHAEGDAATLHGSSLGSRFDAPPAQHAQNMRSTAGFARWAHHVLLTEPKLL